jgi:hypothetical protein
VDTRARNDERKNQRAREHEREFKERKKKRENSRSAKIKQRGSAKARMQKRKIEGPKKSAKAPAQRDLLGSAKAQARRLKKSASPALLETRFHSQNLVSKGKSKGLE